MELHIGETNLNKNGSKMTVVKYINYDNIIVEFEDGYKTSIRYDIFKSGSVKNPNDKIIFNKGYLGEGKYNTRNNKNIYRTWYDIMMRCYNFQVQEKHPTYKGCIVCKEWHNFQNFAQWYEYNYYVINNEKMCVDKDILIKGNKIYSIERGIYPIGVHYDKNKKKYMSNCTIKNKIKHLGSYDTPQEAFNAYKKFKEKYIKEVADTYKNKYPQFPKKLYDAMYNYRVQITD